jgi:hypothetical protein
MVASSHAPYKNRVLTLMTGDDFIREAKRYGHEEVMDDWDFLDKSLTKNLPSMAAYSAGTRSECRRGLATKPRLAAGCLAFGYLRPGDRALLPGLAHLARMVSPANSALGTSCC